MQLLSIGGATMHQSFGRLNNAASEVSSGKLEDAIPKMKEAEVQAAAGGSLVRSADQQLESLIELVLQ